MKTYNLGEDPRDVEASQIARRRQLAELLTAQSINGGPVYSDKAGIARVLTGILGGMQTREAEGQERELAERKDKERGADFDRLFEFINQKPDVGPGLPQVDDDGNQMPGNMAQTADKRAQLARALVGSRNPTIAQFGLNAIMPKQEEAYTLSEGARRFQGGRLVAENPKAEKPDTPKRGELRKIIKGGEEIQQEWTGAGWEEVGRGSRFAPQQPDRSLVEVVDPTNPRRTILVPRDQASGKAGPGTITAGKDSREDLDSLRKEFNALEPVKNYNAVMPIVEAARKAPDTPQGDFALIYGVGKVLDPNSVVREGEMGMVIKAGSPAQRVEGYLRHLQGKGQLTPDMRKGLQVILDQRAAEYENSYRAARSTYEGIVKNRGHDSSEMFLESGQKPVGSPASRGGPQPGTVVDGYRFKGGNPSDRASWEPL